MMICHNIPAGGFMTGKNWYSKKKSWSDLVHDETKDNAKKAAKLRSAGKPVKDIAKALGLSKSRIYEYLRTK